MTKNLVLTDYAYSSILNMILTSEIKPGERIREDILAEKLGTSRTPVREAVNRLVQNGFIINKKRRGLYCINISISELLDLLDLRLVLESLSIEKCIDLATDEDIDNIEKIIKDFNEKYDNILRNLDKRNGKEISQLHNEYDVKFHVAIAEVSKSKKLIQYINEVENLLLIARQRIYTNTEGKSIILLSWKQHELMIESIRTRDKLAARKMLEQHLQLMKDTQINIEDTEEFDLDLKAVSET